MIRISKVILVLTRLAIIGFCLFIGGCIDKTKSDISSKSNLETLKDTARSHKDSSLRTELGLKEYGGITTTLDNQIEAFVTDILDTNKVKHSAEYLSRLEVGHITIFSFNGLKNYYAFSDKRYPQKALPNYYEHFTVFVFEYESELSASNSFKSVYTNSYLNAEQLDSLRTSNPKLLTSISNSLKPGGLICQKNNYIFSLVKTCRKPPLKNDWNEYEELLIRSISAEGEAINTLNAKCGTMKYKFEKRKPMDDRG